MRESVTSALLEYRTTLKQQRERISELEGECQQLQEQNQSLEERVGELELKLRRVISAKENLNLKVVQLSEQLEGEKLPAIIILLHILNVRLYSGTSK